MMQRVRAGKNETGRPDPTRAPLILQPLILHKPGSRSLVSWSPRHNTKCNGMVPGPSRVTPIRRDIVLSDAGQQVADVAFDLWVSSAFRGCSPEEALLTAMTAVRMVKGKPSPGLFLAPKRKHDVHPPIASEA
jgi:hypothetical protein